MLGAKLSSHNIPQNGTEKDLKLIVGCYADSNLMHAAPCIHQCMNIFSTTIMAVTSPNSAFPSLWMSRYPMRTCKPVPLSESCVRALQSSMWQVEMHGTVWKWCVQTQKTAELTTFHLALQARCRSTINQFMISMITCASLRTLGALMPPFAVK